MKIELTYHSKIRYVDRVAREEIESEIRESYVVPMKLLRRLGLIEKERRAGFIYAFNPISGLIYCLKRNRESLKLITIYVVEDVRLDILREFVFKQLSEKDKVKNIRREECYV